MPTRNFNGKEFKYHVNEKSKRKAEQVKNSVKKLGFKVRITKSLNNGYEIWIRRD